MGAEVKFLGAREPRTTAAKVGFEPKLTALSLFRYAQQGLPSWIGGHGTEA